MKTAGIIVLVPIVMTLEIVMTICTLMIYALSREEDTPFMTTQLINKL